MSLFRIFQMEKSGSVEFAPLFRIEIADWRTISKDSAKLILSQAEKALQSTVATATILNGRALSMIQIMIPLIGADFAYLINKMQGRDYNNRLDFQVLIFLLLVLCLALAVAILMYKISPIKDVGSEPRKLAFEKLLMFDENNQELVLLINEIESYQDRIDFNLKYNTRKAQQYQTVLLILLVGFLLSAFYAGLFLYHR